MPFEPRPLGRTGLVVGPVGIGSSYGVGERDLARAVDAGLNFFYWASLRRGAMRRAVRGSAARARLVVAAATFARWPLLVRRRAEKAASDLGLDALDLFVLAWFQQPPSDGVVESLVRLRERGVARAIGLSTHARALAAQIVADAATPFDVVLVRYNAAHRGAEREVFPRLCAAGPAVVAFTATRWGTLPRAGLSATDCYRFCLSDPAVAACLSGPRDGRELDAAIAAAAAGPLDETEAGRAREIGDLVYGRKTRAAPAVQ